MSNFASMEGEWAEPLMVTVNGKQYPTQLYNGVQRFVPDAAVEKLVTLAGEHGPLIGKPAVNFYFEIPDSLKSLDHLSKVVNHLVAMNLFGYYGLNELAWDLNNKQFTPQEWIDFSVLHGWSVGGFSSSVSQSLANAGYAVDYIDPEDGELYDDVSAYFTMENPLWVE